ncbi:unnamed protein product [Diatraea saccharalis]|uniref:Uncharacterized protein n=1 Tax=Diatraea saccharalis TaxID=40085 RepID=A0A9N9WFZ2_9NEOP|nr:unnamed protein product [Diatraea saccharalis]
MSSDSESSATPPKKIPKKRGWTAKKKGEKVFKRRTQTFRDEWLQNLTFRDWLEPDPKYPKKAKCAFCPASSLVAETTNLKSNAESKKDLKNKPGASGLQSQMLTSFGFKIGAIPKNKQKDRAEIKLAAFFVEHNIAFAVADHLTDLPKDLVLSKLQALGPVPALSNDFRERVPTLIPLMEVVPRIIASFDDIKNSR